MNRTRVMLIAFFLVGLLGISTSFASARFGDFRFGAIAYSHSSGRLARAGHSTARPKLRGRRSLYAIVPTATPWCCLETLAARWRGRATARS